MMFETPAYGLWIPATVGMLAFMPLAFGFFRRLRKTPPVIPQSPTRQQWHDRSLEAIAAELATDPANGLTSDEVQRRLQRDGRNELRKGKGVSALAMLLGQFNSLVIWVLIGAAAVSVFLGEKADGIAIIAIVVLNALIGFIQEFRAGKAAAALARLAAPKARVIRGGHAAVIASAEVVTGDVLLLEAGDLVAADARLVEASALRASEASLTGESKPVDKAAGVLPLETPLAERSNSVFLGTSIAGGSARALVVATGMATELGRIAQLLETAESGATPLQQRLDRVARHLLWACLGIVALVFVLGLLRSVAPFELFLGAVSLAVAAIPEGLPAVVTVSLALGVQRMIRRNALVRRLPSVETLGCAEVICTDKTGTLTAGEMTARRLFAGRRLYKVTGEGYAAEGVFLSENTERIPAQDPDLYALLYAAAACNDAEIVEEKSPPLKKGGQGGFSIVGDPTEGALLVAAAKGGISRAEIETAAPRLAVLPFDSGRKRMTVVRKQGTTACAFVKGAPEVLLERCAFIQNDGEIRPLSGEDRTAIIQACAWMAHDALRVLAVAQRSLADSGAGEAEIERELLFLGLFGLQDPPRPEAGSAVAKCRSAGIKTVMITGDHADTAGAIARELGILTGGDTLLTGGDLARMTEGELAQRVRRIAVYARVTAEDKLRNLVTDGLPALALATDPIDPDVLNRPPRPPQAQLLDREFIRLTVLTGFLTAATALAAFAYEFYLDGSEEQARDAAFTALVIAELLRAFGARSNSKTIFEISFFSNLWLFLIVAVSFSLQLAIHHVAVLQSLFSIEPLSMEQCLSWMGLGFVPLTVLEIRKVLLRKRLKKG